MNKYFIQLFLKENTVILPGFGALMLVNDRLSEIIFLPDLKTDDGKLASYIAETEGVEEQNAQNTIAKFIREIQANLNKGDSFDIFEFGSFKKDETGAIVFLSSMKEKIDTSDSLIPSSSKNQAVREQKQLKIDALAEKEIIFNSIQEEKAPMPIEDETTNPTDSLSLIRALLGNNKDNEH